MPELIILEPKDLEKLAGWTIVKAEGDQTGDNPMITLRVSHPYAEKDVKLQIFAHVSMSIIPQKNLVQAIPQLSTRSSNIEEEGNGT